MESSVYEYTNEFSETSLMLAVREGDIDTVKTLLNAGADRYETDVNGWTAFMYAVDRGDIQLVTLLRDEVTIRMKDASGQTPFFRAVIHGHIDIVELLFEENDADHVDMHGMNALLHAIDNGQEEIAILLINSGRFDLNKQDKEGRTALHHAIVDIMNLVVELLVEKGVDVNIQDIEGITPLHEAVFKENVDLINMLTKAGGDHNLPSFQGSTPLMTSLYYNTDVTKALLAGGSDPFIRIDGNESAYEYAVRKRIDNVIKLMTADM